MLLDGSTLKFCLPSFYQHQTAGVRSVDIDTNCNVELMIETLNKIWLHHKQIMITMNTFHNIVYQTPVFMCSIQQHFWSKYASLFSTDNIAQSRRQGENKKNVLN